MRKEMDKNSEGGHGLEAEHVPVRQNGKLDQFE